MTLSSLLEHLAANGVVAKTSVPDVQFRQSPDGPALTEAVVAPKRARIPCPHVRTVIVPGLQLRHLSGDWEPAYLTYDHLDASDWYVQEGAP